MIGYSQRVAKVSATYTYYAPETMSVEEAKRVALDRAKIQAIADEFGTIVSQSTSTIVSNKNGETDSHFFSVGGSDVKGEWIESLVDPKYNISFDDRCVVVTCEVQGLIREVLDHKIEFEAMPLKNAPNINYATTEFINGDDLYLYFKSPISGYLSVFLISDKNVFCLLPYRKDTENAFRITADTEYFFFSKEKTSIDKKLVDEYTLSSYNSKEFNDIIIIFSPSMFHKSNLKKEKEESIPKYTTLNQFNNWLSKLRLKNNNITVSQISLTIKNNES